MKQDPALGTALSGDEIEQLAQNADGRYVRTRTPGLSRLSRTEFNIVWAICTLIGSVAILEAVGLVVLPQEWMQGAVFVFLALAIGWGIAVGGTFLLNAITRLAHLLRHPCPEFSCARCGKRVPIRKYLEKERCPFCGTNRLYCGKCGRPTTYAELFHGEGCAHCGNQTVKVYQ